MFFSIFFSIFIQNSPLVKLCLTNKFTFDIKLFTFPLKHIDLLTPSGECGPKLFAVISEDSGKLTGTLHSFKHTK